MAAGATYSQIATTTISGSSTNSISFSSIPSTYTDLVIVLNAANTVGGYDTIVRFNDDTNSNYSFTRVSGDGTNPVSGRGSNQTGFNWAGYLGTTIGTVVTQIFNYANTTTNKTALSRSSSSEFGPWASVGLWRSTSAITKVTITFASQNFASGSTASLYGIVAA